MQPVSCSIDALGAPTLKFTPNRDLAAAMILVWYHWIQVVSPVLLDTRGLLLD